MRAHLPLLLALAALAACGPDRRSAPASSSPSSAPSAAAPANGDAEGDADDDWEDPALDMHHRWQVKTTLAPDADLEHPTFVSLPVLASFPDAPGVAKSDRRYQTARIPAYPNAPHLREGEIVSTRGWLRLVAHPGDGDYHLQLTPSPTQTAGALIVEIPDSDRTPDGRLRPIVSAVRRFVRDDLLGGEKPKKKGTLLPQPVEVTVTGALFYDDAHVGEPPRGKRGETAGTLWEIHPVTSIARI